MLVFVSLQSGRANRKRRLSSEFDTSYFADFGAEIAAAHAVVDAACAEALEALAEHESLREEEWNRTHDGGGSSLGFGSFRSGLGGAMAGAGGGPSGLSRGDGFESSDTSLASTSISSLSLLDSPRLQGTFGGNGSGSPRTQMC